MYNALQLNSENQLLREENLRQKKKTKAQRRIATGGTLTVAQGQELASPPNPRKRKSPANGPIENVSSETASGPAKEKRAPMKCSKCGSLIHNARNCTES
ncbi:hypothetical protein DL95DRAFT_502723 [Leptodontidium sp. 2 PMI_412]|nr:hypothetical protein DL95DRAFT_502723 [Leptodontidium sp. 2 PMI_412]